MQNTFHHHPGHMDYYQEYGEIGKEFMQSFKYVLDIPAGARQQARQRSGMVIDSVQHQARDTEQSQHHQQ